MAGTPQGSGRALMSEPALSCDPGTEEVCFSVSPPGTCSLTIALDVEQKDSTPTDAKSAEDRVAAEGPTEGMKASVQTQCKGSDCSEDQLMGLGGMEEDLSHSRTAW
ncbi:UNVERIFIED_CONTAM: hypothetical protein K2H54_041039, partial [Gekko kuhli]